MSKRIMSIANYTVFKTNKQIYRQINSHTKFYNAIIIDSAAPVAAVWPPSSLPLTERMTDQSLL
jgi:hypothetical protein